MLAQWIERTEVRARGDDPILRVVLQFRKDLAAADRAPDPDHAHDRLGARSPSLYTAWEVYSDRNPTMRDLLEAFILTGMAPGSAAEACGLPADTLAAFESVFFDVVTRLNQTQFINSEAIGPAIPAATEVDLGRFWKWAAYTHGLAVLKSLLKGDLVGRAVTDPADVGPAADELIADGLRVDALRAVRALHPVRDASLILDHLDKMRKRASAEDAAATSDSRVEPYSLVKALGVGLRYKKPTDVSPGAPDAEPRTSEPAAAKEINPDSPAADPPFGESG
jgi:hypothetical protein